MNFEIAIVLMDLKLPTTLFQTTNHSWKADQSCCG